MSFVRELTANDIEKTAASLLAEFLLVILVRYLQTAIDNSYVYGDPIGENPAWLFER